MVKRMSILIALAIAGGATAEVLSPSLSCPGGCVVLAQAPSRADLGTKPIGPPRAALPELALKLEPVFPPISMPCSSFMDRRASGRVDARR